MFNVETLSYDDLTDEEKIRGSGDEYATYIKITHNGETVGLFSDAMEPEDARFYRSLSWVSDEIRKAYELGKEDEAARINA